MRGTAFLGLALDSAPDAAAAAAAVVDHVATEGRLLPSVYLARGGRLRCAALRGYWQARDGVSPSAGVIGRTYTTATEHVVTDVAASDDYLEANPGVVVEACLPVTAGGRTVGVLNVESHDALHDGDLERLRECADLLGRRIEALGGLPDESTTQRLLGHVAELAALEDSDAIVDALLHAARDLVPLDSALLVRTTATQGLAAAGAVGPLAAVLRAAPTEPFVEWVRDGTSCFTVGAPDAPAAANLGDLRNGGVEALVGVGLFAHGELLGVLVLASGEPAAVDTDDVEVLEQLATHAAACLRTAELLGSLRARAASDPLTGLGHHATFHEALAASHRRPTTAVVVCDIDGFKRLNDTYGHGHGDRVLSGIADAMSGALRRGDRLFRIGGDEFAALLAVESKAEALGAASRLREAVNEARLDVTISIGVAVPHADESDASLLARADRALYTVKGAGRDGVALANDEPLPSTPAVGLGVGGPPAVG
jgi:diguanylate cyclase (GGDEF)-like protein